ncbi:MAG: hypothetical protein WCA19_16655 [Candidatus Acidiferrales bacterium]
MRYGFLAVFVLLKTLFRFRDSHPSPDSGWQVESQCLYSLAFHVSVQFGTFAFIWSKQIIPTAGRELRFQACQPLLGQGLQLGVSASSGARGRKGNSYLKLLRHFPKTARPRPHGALFDPGILIS